MLNGQHREFTLTSGAALADLLRELGLQMDRIAVEQNGTIVPRSIWPTTPVTEGDRLEVVHFVGGGACKADCPVRDRSRVSHCAP